MFQDISNGRHNVLTKSLSVHVSLQKQNVLYTNGFKNKVPQTPSKEPSKRFVPQLARISEVTIGEPTPRVSKHGQFLFKDSKRRSISVISNDQGSQQFGALFKDFKLPASVFRPVIEYDVVSNFANFSLS